MRSQTAVRRQRTEQPRSNRTSNERFRGLEPLQWGLAGLEPAASSLSGIEGSALCGPAFPQVARDRKGRRDAFLATSFQALQANRARVAGGWDGTSPASGGRDRGVGPEPVRPPPVP